MLTKINRENNRPAIAALVWGAPKSGKTVFAGTAGDRSLFISNGMGALTLESKWFFDKYKCTPYIKKIPYDSIHNKERSVDLIGETIQDALDNHKDDIDTIIIDDSSALTESSLLKAVEYNAVDGRSKTLDKAKQFESAIATQGDFGTEIKMTTQFIASIISDCKYHNKNFILLAHERFVWTKPKSKGEDKKLIAVVPAFTGADASPGRMPALFDWILHTKAKSGIRQGKEFSDYSMITNETVSMPDIGNVVTAGIRGNGGVIAKEMKDPKFLEMYDLLYPIPK